MIAWIGAGVWLVESTTTGGRVWFRQIVMSKTLYKKSNKHTCPQLNYHPMQTGYLSCNECLAIYNSAYFYQLTQYAKYTLNNIKINKPG